MDASGLLTRQVFASANAYFLVYSRECAPSFYGEAALAGVEPSSIEATLYAGLLRTQYEGNCRAFYDSEVIYRHMGAIIYSSAAFPEGPAGLTAREAAIYGHAVWIEMTAVRNRCSVSDRGGVGLDNRATDSIRGKARVGDLMGVARGVIETFRQMQAKGFSAFLTVAERCRMMRDSARSLVRSLIAEGFLGRNEVEL